MKLTGGLVYLVIIKEVCLILLLLQSPEHGLQLCLEALPLTKDHSLSGATHTLTLVLSLLAVDDLMGWSMHTVYPKTGAINHLETP